MNAIQQELERLENALAGLEHLINRLALTVEDERFIKKRVTNLATRLLRLQDSLYLC